MRFTFLPSSAIPFHGKTLDERPLGGTETAVIRLAAELDARGHEVIVFSKHPNPPLTKPLYLPMQQLGQVTQTDVLIVVREWLPLFCGIQCQRRLFWTGDAFDQPQTLGLGDKRIVDAIDGFLAVSQWQADTIAQASGFPGEKMWVIRNGVHPKFFDGQVRRRRTRMIYSSTPYRGLAHLPRLYKRIRAEVPTAELAVFSGYDVYAEQLGAIPAGHEGAARDLERVTQALTALPGVTYSPSVTQAMLATEFQTASVLAYPNTFAETSCITAMEAMRAGCVPLSTKLGGLPETVGEGGVLIEGLPGNPLYDDRFVAEAVRLLTDDQYWQQLSTKAQQLSQRYSWAAVAESLLKQLAASGLPG